MSTSKIVLICVFILFIINFTLAWICFFKFQAIPDTLITCVAGSGAIADIASGVVGITKILKNKNKGGDK